jgi:hypothetical protein
MSYKENKEAIPYFIHLLNKFLFMKIHSSLAILTLCCLGVNNSKKNWEFLSKF